MMCNSNIHQKMMFSQEDTMYHQIQNKSNMINTKVVTDLSSPFYHYSPQYNTYAYPYNPSLSSKYDITESRVRHPYVSFSGNTSNFEDRRDLSQSPQYYPNHFQRDKLDQDCEVVKDKSYSTTELVKPKEEHEIKREPCESKAEQYQHMQPYRQEPLIKEDSGKREEILCQRTSVITRTNQANLEYKARMLKYEGSLLRHTGNRNKIQ